MPVRVLIVWVASLLAVEIAASQGCESVVCNQPAQYLVAYDSEALTAADLSALLAPHSTGRLVLGGVAGLAAGALGGAALGYLTGGPASGESMFWVTPGVAIGGVLGAAIGAPVGVHLANGSRGDLPLSVLGATAAGLAGVLVVVLLDRAHLPAAGDAVLIGAIPLVQIGAGVMIQRATTR